MYRRKRRSYRRRGRAKTSMRRRSARPLKIGYRM